MEITTEMIKELREATGAGILDCRKALTDANGDFDKAVDFLREDEIPAAVLEHEGDIARARAKEEGKPEAIHEKIVAGRLEKFKDEVVLLRQAYIRDEEVTIEKLVLQTIGTTGENIIVRRFQRWELGESIGG